jgi:hypothetical protein
VLNETARVQYSCKTKLRADGQAEVHVSSGEESEAVTKEEDGSEDEFVTAAAAAGCACSSVTRSVSWSSPLPSPPSISSASFRLSASSPLSNLAPFFHREASDLDLG